MTKLTPLASSRDKSQVCGATQESHSILEEQSRFPSRECENMPRTGQCHRGVSPQHHRSTHFKSMLPLLHVGLQGGSGTWLQVLRQGAETKIWSRLSATQEAMAGLGKWGPMFEFLFTATTWTHTDTHRHRHTHTHTKEEIQTFNIEKIWMC